MSANINIMNGQASMAYVGNVPWHGLGKEVPDLMQITAALELAQADYHVVKMPLEWYRKINYEQPRPAEYQRFPIRNKFATIRTDTDQYLGIVGKSYTVLQNRDAYSVVDDLVGEGAATISTVGVLGNGERMWVLCKLPDNIVVGDKGDELKQYLLIVNSHDGTFGVRLALTMVRVVCENTLRMALNNNIGQIIIRHSSNVKERVQNAHRILQLTNTVSQNAQSILNQLHKVKLSEDMLDHFLQTLIPDKDTDKEIRDKGKVPATDQHREGIRHFALNDKLAAGTLWGAVNGVTEYVDHVLAHVTNDRARLNYLWFGSGQRLKQNALGLAQDYCDVLTGDPVQ